MLAPSHPGYHGATGQEQLDDSLDLALYYLDFLDELQLESPYVVGHGLGGLVVQALLDRGLGSCGVALASAPIRGIWTLPYARMRVVTPQLLAGGRCVQLSPAQFHQAFMNGASRDEADRAYERHVVPGPSRVLLQAGLANFNPFADTSIDVGSLRTATAWRTAFSTSGCRMNSGTSATRSWSGTSKRTDSRSANRIP